MRLVRRTIVSNRGLERSGFLVELNNCFYTAGMIEENKKVIPIVVTMLRVIWQ